MASFTITDNENSFSFQRENETTLHGSKNYWNLWNSIGNVLKLGRDNNIQFIIDVTVDSVNINGTTNPPGTFATGKDLYNALEEVFFLANSVFTEPITFDSDKIITAPVITTNMDDFNPTGFQKDGDGKIISYQIDLSSDGNNRITGLKAPNPPVAVRVQLYNKGLAGNTGTISIRKEDSKSSPENRIKSSSNISLVHTRKIVLEYDVSDLRYTHIS